jgi:hypothetical protein
MSSLFLYLISQNENGGYDTYDSAVICAESENEARLIHPGGEGYSFGFNGTWASHPDGVEVKLIGTAKRGMKKGEVICASFNAG